MKFLSSFIRSWQSHRALLSDLTHAEIRRKLQALAPEGVILKVKKATPSRIELWADAYGQIWQVILTPSFHGPQILVTGSDAEKQSRLSRMLGMQLELLGVELESEPELLESR